MQNSLTFTEWIAKGQCAISYVKHGGSTFIKVLDRNTDCQWVWVTLVNVVTNSEMNMYHN